MIHIGTRLAAICLLFLASYQQVQAQNDLVNRLENVATLIQADRLAEAERQLSVILRSNPNQPDALNLLGAVRAKQRRYDEAEKLFTRAISVDAALLSARMNLVQLHLLQNKPQSAISELKQVLRLQPENEEVFDRLTGLLLVQKQFDEFINVVEQSKSSRTISFSLLLSLGDAYLEKRNAVKAEENFKLALQQRSDDADAILGLAQAAQLKGDTASASSYLDRAKQLQVNSAATLHRFALVAWALGRFEEANRALIEAVKLKPDEPVFYVALGTTWLKKPDLVEAEQAFRRALELQSDNSEAQMYLGYTLMLQGKYSDARALLEKSLEKQSTVPQTFFYLGLISQQEGDDQAAIRQFKKTLDLLPAYADAHVAMGRSYLNLKNYSQAQMELELAVKLNPNDAEAHYQLAILYARLKDPGRAQQQMQIVERLKEAAKQPTP